MKTGNRRSVLLKGETLNDYNDALAKFPDEQSQKQEIWRRMKLNCMTKEVEIAYRNHCKNLGVKLPSEPGEARDLAQNPNTRTQPSRIADSIKSQVRQSEIKPYYMDKD